MALRDVIRTRQADLRIINTAGMRKRLPRKSGEERDRERERGRRKEGKDREKETPGL